MQDRCSLSVRPWIWQEADIAHEAVTTVVNTRWATRTSSCNCLISPAVPMLLAVPGGKTHPTFHCFTAGILEASFIAFCVAEGRRAAALLSKTDALSSSQLLPKLKLSIPETALALQKGSGESRENFHSSLQPPVLAWAFSMRTWA